MRITQHLLIPSADMTQMNGNQPDKCALKILLGRYWSPQGWVPDNKRTVALEDFEYAKSKGLMFDPLEISHSGVMSKLLSALRKAGPCLTADAFIASLSTRRLDWRSALGSYAVFRNVRDHEPMSEDGRSCDVCRLYLKRCVEDLNVLNFERFKWGGVRHTSPLYAMLDLELFLDSSVPKPSPSDIQIFRDLVRLFMSYVLSFIYVGIYWNKLQYASYPPVSALPMLNARFATA